MNERVSGEDIILLVDDDPGDQELTRRALDESKLPIALQVASNGVDALAYLHELEANKQTSHYPSLILLDLNMPMLDGHEVLRRIRATASFRRIPVIMLTTSDRAEDVLRCYDCGCNSYIRKPVELDQFVEAVKQLSAYWFELVMRPTGNTIHVR